MADKIRIRTLWGQRPVNSGADLPELMVAWDEFCVDAYPEGYELDKQKAVESWGADLVAQRELVLTIPLDKVEEAFRSPTIEGDVVTE